MFKLNERCIRDRLNHLMKNFKRNDSEEKRASGIEVEEKGELHKGLRDMVQLFDDIEKILKEEMQQRHKNLNWRLRKQKNYV